jgi:hypothetical protein
LVYKLRGAHGHDWTRRGRRLGDECGRFLTEARYTAERLHRLRHGPLAIRLSLEPILLHETEIALRDAQRCAQIVDEEIQSLCDLIALS